jgi:hypothetical protein
MEFAQLEIVMPGLTGIHAGTVPPWIAGQARNDSLKPGRTEP